MILRALAAAMLVLSCVPLAAQQQTSLAPGAVLRGLDKVSGQTTDLEVRSGSVTRFGRLDIAVRECRYPAGNRVGDAYAGMLIVDSVSDEQVFDGWMVASAPALSAMDHPRYDIWVIRCITS